MLIDYSSAPRRVVLQVLSRFSRAAVASLIVVAACLLAPRTAGATNPPPQQNGFLTVTTAGQNTPPGQSISTVTAGTMITLTVQFNTFGPPNSPPGTAIFCDNEDINTGGQICSDIHVIGTAQLVYKGSKANTASISYIPGIGSHSYTVDFTRGYSVSNTVAITVTGKYPTTTTISSSGSAGNYTLTGTVLGSDLGTVPPSGKVSFLDTTNNNFNLGSATLGNPMYFLGTSTPSPAFIGPTQGPYGPVLDVAIADFNGDGIPDAAILFESLSGNVIALFQGLPGGGYLQQFPNIQAPGATRLAVGDLDSNGLPDIVTVTGPPSTFPIVSYLNYGDWNFVEADTQAIGGGPGALGAFILGDFNLDGNLDMLALGVPSGFPSVAPPTCSPMRAKGMARLLTATRFPRALTSTTLPIIRSRSPPGTSTGTYCPDSQCSAPVTRL